MQKKRPDCIKHFSEIQDADTLKYAGSDELLSIGSPFGKKLNLKKLGIHHEVLPSGRRTSFPHAESDEEEFVYVIEGNPDLWLDGDLYRLAPGDGVGFQSGTGAAHSFINNTNVPVRLLVVGEANKPSNKVIYPINPELRETRRASWWTDAPQRNIGEHDGKPDAIKNIKK